MLICMNIAIDCIDDLALHFQYWQTPLLIAAFKGNIQIMEELLKAKADPNFMSKVRVLYCPDVSIASI